jgi:hypothetical protein
MNSNVQVLFYDESYDLQIQQIIPQNQKIKELRRNALQINFQL